MEGKKRGSNKPRGQHMTAVRSRQEVPARSGVKLLLFL
jgi:hypothetical protein